MTHDTEARRRAAKRDRVIRMAEWVLAQAFRSASIAEIRASQIRIREAVVEEMRRRIRR